MSSKGGIVSEPLSTTGCLTLGVGHVVVSRRVPVTRLEEPMVGRVVGKDGASLGTPSGLERRTEGDRTVGCRSPLHGK